jgi:hypothetical protein
VLADTNFGKSACPFAAKLLAAKRIREILAP